MQNKIALVTGGSRGLGKDAAIRLAEAGKDIILTFHTKKEEAEEVVKTIESLGRKAVALPFDLSDFPAIDSFLTTVKEALKTKWDTDKFDYLVNNAGIGATIPFAQATEADFDLFMNIHFKSVYFLTQKALTMMNDNGSIVNLSSGTTRFCVHGYSIYASMKGAIETFTRYLAKEIGSRGINANVVAPGPIETDFNNAAIRNNVQMKSFLTNQTALGRVGVADDIGKIIAFLCSDEARWINGQRIEASGGINL
jgi:NAD(P)-dependent dehydrogenase (short-subunit alcohol dehydrogenase family)